MANFSFDIVSEYDVGEVTNAVDQAQREIATRYDFKNTPAAVEFTSNDKAGVTITGDSQYQLDAVLDVLRNKFIKREVPVTVLDASKTPVQGGKEMRLEVPFKKGLDQEKAKKITSLIREHYPKAKTQIQGEAVRVTSASKDELQAIMQLLRAADFEYPLSFTNYR